MISYCFHRVGPISHLTREMRAYNYPLAQCASHIRPRTLLPLPTPAIVKYHCSSQLIHSFPKYLTTRYSPNSKTEPIYERTIGGAADHIQEASLPQGRATRPLKKGVPAVPPLPHRESRCPHRPLSALKAVSVTGNIASGYGTKQIARNKRTGSDP